MDVLYQGSGTLRSAICRLARPPRSRCGVATVVQTASLHLHLLEENASLHLLEGTASLHLLVGGRTAGDEVEDRGAEVGESLLAYAAAAEQRGR